MDTLSLSPAGGAGAAASGTTLEILAPYLPYGIEVETGIGRCRILGLGLDVGNYPLEVCTSDDYEDGVINGRSYYGFDQVLPVLRPFSQLTVPLPDGTVPAVEVAKMIYVTGYASASDAKPFDEPYCFLTMQGDVEVVDMNGPGSVSIDQNMGIWASCRAVPLSAYEYLRRLHFAPPVNGRPLVEGIDFVAAAPATPEAEREESHE